jgi:hypothetical protein
LFCTTAEAQVCSATVCLALPTPAVVKVVEQPGHPCCATSVVGLLAPRAVMSRTATNLSVHLAQDIDPIAESVAGAAGFIKSLAAPLPVGMSAAVMVKMLPAMRIKVVNLPQFRAQLLRFVGFILSLFFSARRLRFSLLRPETQNPLDIYCLKPTLFWP